MDKERCQTQVAQSIRLFASSTYSYKVYKDFREVKKERRQWNFL